MNTSLTALLLKVKATLGSFILAHPTVLATVLKYPRIANAVLTPARVVVLVSNQSFRKR